MFIRMLFVLLFFSAGVSFGAEKLANQSLIQEEMVALDSAFKTTVEAIVLDEPERIPPAFDEVKALRKQVEHAVKSGAGLALPRNQKRFREFVRLDGKFHRELEALIKAAKKENVIAVRRQAHRMLDLCVRCHRVFRK